jgi:hypothetical protein
MDKTNAPVRRRIVAVRKALHLPQSAMWLPSHARAEAESDMAEVRHNRRTRRLHHYLRRDDGTSHTTVPAGFRKQRRRRVNACARVARRINRV